jgi:hypothetical protein
MFIIGRNEMESKRDRKKEPPTEALGVLHFFWFVWIDDEVSDGAQEGHEDDDQCP